MEPIDLKEDDKSLNIVLGSYYHATNSGCERLARLYHVTAILNLQTNAEIKEC